MCMSCGRPNDGTIVGAHSNFGDGKGMGQKSHDVLAYVCLDCHDIIDGRQHKDLDRTMREALFYHAAYESTVWLLKTGYLKVGKP